MKKILVSLLLLAALCLSACGGTPKLEGAWEIDGEGEIIMFYDNDICEVDGEEMRYIVLDSHTISLDGELYEYTIIDKKTKKLTLDEK